jgi:hypothetical protein
MSTTGPFFGDPTIGGSGDGYYPLTVDPIVDTYCADSWATIGQAPTYASTFSAAANPNYPQSGNPDDITTYGPPHLNQTIICANGDLYCLANDLENTDIIVWQLDPDTAVAIPFLRWSASGANGQYIPNDLGWDGTHFYVVATDGVNTCVVHRFDASGSDLGQLASITTAVSAPASPGQSGTEYLGNPVLVPLTNGQLLVIVQIANVTGGSDGPSVNFYTAYLWLITPGGDTALSGYLNLATDAHGGNYPTVADAVQSIDGTLWLVLSDFAPALSTYTSEGSLIADISPLDASQTGANLIVLSGVPGGSGGGVGPGFYGLAGAYNSPGAVGDDEIHISAICPVITRSTSAYRYWQSRRRVQHLPGHPQRPLLPSWLVPGQHVGRGRLLGHQRHPTAVEHWVTQRCEHDRLRRHPRLLLGDQ